MRIASYKVAVHGGKVSAYLFVALCLVTSADCSGRQEHKVHATAGLTASML